MTRTLDSKLVSDWREVIPVVKPFYERFFGEEMPNDLKIEMDACNQFVSINPVLGGYNFLEDKILLIPYSKARFEETLVHELTHYRFEKHTELIREDSAKLKKLSREDPICGEHMGKFLRDIFLHECIANTVALVFNYQINGLYEESQPPLKEVECILQEAQNFHDELAFQLMDSLGLPRMCGRYLATKYHSDPNLWSKLKALRTIDDLKRLVEE